MLELADPLWLLAAPLGLAAPLLARRPRLPWPAFALSSGRATLRQRLAPLPDLLTGLGLAALAVALARPQDVDRERIVEREGIDILLVLDTSGSMEAEDYTVGGRPSSRLAAARHVLARFVEGRPDDRIGLVVFGEEAFTHVPLTTDHRAMGAFIEQVELGMAGPRATAVGDAIAVAVQRLKGLDAPSRVVILLTDGQSNAGQLEPLDAARAAAALGVKVYTIGVGGVGGRGLLGLLGGGGGGDLDEPTLKAIADRTGAAYFRAADTDTLERVYETIDALERSTAEVTELVHTEERFRPWLVGGIGMLLVGQLLGQTALRRLP